MGAAVQISALSRLNPDAIKKAKKRLRGVVERFHEHRGSVGLHEDESGDAKLDYHGKATNASLGEVAAYHEFHGRSYIRTWFDENVSRLNAEMSKAMREQYEGNANAVDELMIGFAAELRNWISEREGNLDELAVSTVIAKAKAGLPNPDVPLYATGQLVEAIRAHLDGYRL